MKVNIKEVKYLASDNKNITQGRRYKVIDIKESSRPLYQRPVYQLSGDREEYEMIILDDFDNEYKTLFTNNTFKDMTSTIRDEKLKSLFNED